MHALACFWSVLDPRLRPTKDTRELFERWHGHQAAISLQQRALMEPASSGPSRWQRDAPSVRTCIPAPMHVFLCRRTGTHKARPIFTQKAWRSHVPQDFELEQICTLQGHENEVKSVAWDPSGNLLATCRSAIYSHGFIMLRTHPEAGSFEWMHARTFLRVYVKRDVCKVVNWDVFSICTKICAEGEVTCGMAHACSFAYRERERERERGKNNTCMQLHAHMHTYKYRYARMRTHKQTCAQGRKHEKRRL